MRMILQTVSANGFTAVGPTIHQAVRELEKLTPIHDSAITHSTMFVTDEPPLLEVIPNGVRH